ncbi:MAG: hypothetical protein MUO31_04755 [Thermodesulfovibrionales bacterium]|nr:hypothetical protein [Thermodesulfovibrionales bacterium]
MIEKNCVFIVGAGASQVYGFPLGLELKNRVIDLLARADESILQIYNRRDVDSFREALLKSSRYSIDAFLENRSEFIEIGKMVMSKILVDRERIGNLFMNQKSVTGSPHSYPIDGDWLAYLFNNLMDTDFEKFCKNNVQFITFNYDRTIESYFYDALKYSFGKSDEQVVEVMKNIKIVHVHGQLGFLPWQKTQAEHIRKYSPGPRDLEEMIEDLKIAAAEIKIIHEANTESAEFLEARAILKNASSILFLGFGYAPRNIERLKLQVDIRNKNIWGTCKGLRVAESDGINRKYFQGSNINFNDTDCLEFLRNLSRNTFNN